MRDTATTPSPERDDSPTISDPELLDAIRHYGFGVLLEVTNGITTYAKRQEKKRQVTRAKKVFQRLAGDDTRIVGGIALIKTANHIKGIEELDFTIRISKYNTLLLANAAQHILQTDRLDIDCKRIISENLGRGDRFNSQDLAEYLLRPRKHSVARSGGGFRLSPKKQRAKDDFDISGVIKGVMLEAYVKALFNSSMNSVADHYLTTQVGFTRGGNPGEREMSIDIVIAAYQRDFLDALDRMERIYNRKRPVVTIERYKGLDAAVERENEKPFKRRPQSYQNDSCRYR